VVVLMLLLRVFLRQLSSVHRRHYFVRISASAKLVRNEWFQSTGVYLFRRFVVCRWLKMWVSPIAHAFRIAHHISLLGRCCEANARLVLMMMLMVLLLLLLFLLLMMLLCLRCFLLVMVLVQVLVRLVMVFFFSHFSSLRDTLESLLWRHCGQLACSQV
jgi:hypothetical protein